MSIVLRSAASLFVICTLGLAGMANADSVSPPRTYTVESPDGRFVFVMHAPMPVEMEYRFWVDEVNAEIRQIRERYPESGLYAADEPTTPLWTVDWYAYSVIVFSDGVHLVREGPWPMSRRDEGVSFFANGELLKTYSVSDLVLVPWLMPPTMSHFFWRANTGFDDEALTYRLLTLHLESHRFDVRTGELIRSFSPPKLLLGLVIVAGAAYFIRRRSRRRDVAAGDAGVAGPGGA